MKFVLPEQLPKGLAELDQLRAEIGLEAAAFKAQQEAGHRFSSEDVVRMDYLGSALDEIDSVDRSRIAHHEAGHAVVAALTGGQVVTAEAYPAGVTRDGRSGHCTHLATLPVKQSSHLFAAAGCCAEAVWEHGARASTQHVDARLAGLTDGEFLRRWALTAGAYSASPVTEALAMVRRHWPAVASLAAQIEERGEISHKHVVKALGLSNNHDMHPFELSNIRAGMRSVRDSRQH